MPGGSRIDTLPASFISAISRRPYAVGDVVAGRYRLAQALGDGAMGKVFVAEDRVMGRRVAVKLLKVELLAEESFRRRFQHEAMAIAAIEHRNVARFIDLVVGDPTFLVMEFVPGPTLAAVLKRDKRLEPLRAVRIARRLCWALDAVHRAGVVHRDIKPANVVLAPDVEHGEDPKLIDFGLAKLAFATPEEQLTRAGQFVGTPHYMSPEQIASRDVDARSDVYSLGCMLYHLVAGQPPFGGTDDMQVLYKQIEHAPELVRTLAPTAPRELDGILAKALAKEPERRFASMRAMVEALDTIESPRGGGSPSSFPDATANVRMPPRRFVVRPAWLALFAALLVGVGFLGYRLAHNTSGGLLVVTSLPSAARLRVDGRWLSDPTPAALSGLAPGEHQLRLELGGHAAAERVVKITPSERSVVEVVLPARSRALTVESVPAGAAVFFDGIHMPGETPLTLTVPDDDFHELRLEKLGYEPETQGIKPEDRGPITVSLIPEKEPRGLVWVDSNSAAEVFIDGQDSGFVAPTIGIHVAAGKHVIELRNGSGVSGAPATVTVRSGEAVHVTLSAPGPSEQ